MTKAGTDWALVERLDAASRCITGLHLTDESARLGLANLPFGLASLRYAQGFFGHSEDASFEATPDFAMTRNRTRWNAGWAYGGQVRWSGDFLALELKPNACGMLAGGLTSLPSESEILERLGRLGDSTVDVDGQPARWDFETSNHFFQIYEANWHNSSSPGADFKYIFILHGSGDENRRFLYFDREDFVFANQVRIVETPWGPVHCLTGDAYLAYMDKYREIEAFSLKRRQLFAASVVGDYDVLANVTHQGILGPGRLSLGCVEAQPGMLVPFTQREGLPAYLLSPVGDRLLPHGSGYSVKGAGDPCHLLVSGITGGPRQFYWSGAHTSSGPELNSTNNQGLAPDSVELRSGFERFYRTVPDIRSVPYGYRDSTTIRLLLASGRVRVAASLKPLVRILRDGTRWIQRETEFDL